MSEPTADKPADHSAEKAAEKPGPEKQPQAISRARRWRLRIQRIVLLLLVLAVVMRIVVFFALGPVMRKVAAAYGYDISFQRQELTLLGGDVGLWYVKVTPKSGGPPVLQTDYLRGSISTIELLKGRLFVERAEADGVDLIIERTAQGRIPLLEQFLTAPASSTLAAGTQPSQPGQMNFTSPLKVEAFRLQHVRATIRDAAVTPSLEAVVAMDVRVDSLGALDQPTRFDISIWSDQLLDSMRITGQGKSDQKNLDASASVFLRGFHPGPLAGYLAPFGIRPSAASIGADLSASIKTEPAPPPSIGVKATLTLNGIHLTADDQDAAVLAKLQIDADSIDPTSAKIANISMAGGRLFARRSSNGFIQIGGLELSGGSQPVNAAPAPTTRTATPAARFAVSIRKINIDDMLANFHDQAITPANDIKAILTHFATTADQIDPGNPESVVPFEGHLSIPGIAQAVTVQGSAKPFSPAKTAEMRFGAQGIRLDALKPYLAAIGVESLLDGAEAQGHMTASLHPDPDAVVAADARIDGLKLTQGADLISMGNVQIGGAGIDRETGRLRLRTVAISGPQVEVTRDNLGRLSAANFRWTPGLSTGSSTASTTPQVTRAAPTTAPYFQAFNVAALPRLEIDSFLWDGVRIRLHDQQVQPASTLAIEDAGIEMKDMVFDLASTETKQGTIRAWMKSPQSARQFSLDGTVQSTPGAVALEVQVRAQGLATADLGPYLKPLGIQPNLRDASAQLDVKATLAAVGEKLNGSLDVTNVLLQDGGNELGGINAFQIDGVSVDSSGIDVKSIHIQSPRAQVARETADSLTALGMRLTLPAATATHSPTTTPSSATFVLPFTIALHDLTVTDGQLGWTDHTFEVPVQTTGGASLHLSELVLGKSADPAKFHAVLSAANVLDEMVIDGDASPDPDALSLHANIQGRGIKAGALAAYLPAGTQLTTKDGQVHATIDASLTRNQQGGSSAKLSVENVDWRDGPGADPLLGLDSFHVSAPRVDLANNVIAIDEISLAGFQAQLAKMADGSFTAGGIQFGSAAPSAAAAPSTSATKPSDSAGASSNTASPTTIPAEDVATLVAEARRPLPLVTLQKLDIAVRKIAIQDLSRPSSAPLMLENLQVRNTAPIEMAGPSPDARPPAQLQITGQISPLVGAFTVNTSLAPFAQEPSATIDVQSIGIRGDGITELLPELKPMVDGSKLTDGRFKTQLAVHIKFDRRGPRDFDLSRGFQLDLAVNAVEFRDGAEGPIIGGLESVHLEQARIQPATGSLIAKSLEITKPQARIFRDVDGLHAFGFILPLKAPAGPSTKPAPAPTLSASPAIPGAAPVAKPSGEIRVDRLVISGLDLLYEDRAVTPQFHAPLNGLDVEVRDLTTMALFEPRTIRFSAIVNADKVSLPAAGDSAGSAAGKKNEPTSRPMEDRPLFSQITSSGRLSLYPRPGGYVKTSINGVELAAFQGPAAEQKIDLYSGIFDGNIDAAFRDDGTLDTKSRLVLTDLQLHEPEGGPIARLLKLPMSLDGVIKLVEAPDDSITIPLDVPIKAGTISGPAMVGAGVEALSAVLLTAVASAPVKVVGGVADIFGLGGGKDQKKPAEPVVIQFAPGSTYIEPAAMARLNSVILQAKKNRDMQLTLRHELGSADIALAALRANPPMADVQVMAQQLRMRKITLEDQRSQLAGHLRGQLAALPVDQSQASIAQLRSLDQQIAGTEASMDELYDLLRPGADLQASRRTRAGALSIAQQRLAAVTGLISSSKIPAYADRVHPVAAQYNVTAGEQGGRLIISITSK
jgi:hypothetical protein